MFDCIYNDAEKLYTHEDESVRLQ
jgi:hypothetical protein